MSDNGSNVGFFVSIGSLVGSVIAFIAFWTRFSDRITLADQKAERAILKAESAMQEAAEAKNDVANLREAFEELFRDLSDRIDRRGREDGDSLNAIRRKITEVELFMRDHFVRQPEFAATMSEIKGGLGELNKKVDRLIEHRAAAATPFLG